MRKFRTVVAVAALAAVALLVPSTTTHAAPATKAASTQAVQQAWSWQG